MTWEFRRPPFVVDVRRSSFTSSWTYLSLKSYNCLKGTNLLSFVIAFNWLEILFFSVVVLKSSVRFVDYIQLRLKQFSSLTLMGQLSKQVRRKKTTAQAGPSGWILFKHINNTLLFYISLMLSNARRVLLQCNTRLRLLYLRSITRKCDYVFMKLPGNHFRILHFVPDSVY